MKQMMLKHSRWHGQVNVLPNDTTQKAVYYPHLQKERMKRSKKPFHSFKKTIATLLLISVLVMFFTSIFSSPNIAFAEDEEGKGYSESMIKSMYAPFSDFTEKYAIYQGGTADVPITFYHIDAITNVEIEEHDEWIDFIPSWLESPFNEATGTFQKFINSFNNVLFEWNLYLTTTVISIIGFAFQFDIIEDMLKIIEPSILTIIGINSSEREFTNGGLFDLFFEIIVMIMIIVVIYNLVVTRHLITSFNVILKVICCFTLAILFFSNYSTILTGMHDIAEGMTDTVVSQIGTGLTTGINSAKSQQTSEFTSQLFPNNVDIAKEGEEGLPMKRLLWYFFVESPYAYAQFGSADFGNEDLLKRYEKMISLTPNTEERISYLIDEELRVHNNSMIHADRAFSKLGFMFIVLLINFITAIPIVFVCLALILLQFWYAIIAIIAPFALLIGSIPTMHRVILRYGIELLIPLVLRIALTVILLVLLGLTSLSFEFAQSIGSNDEGQPFFMSYIATAIFIILLFAVTYLLRNRIQDIFAKGNSFLGDLRSATGDIGNMVTGGIGKSVRGVSTTVGAVTGAVIGGVSTGGVGAVSGAMKGANMGKALGNVATGQGDIAGTAMQLYRIGQMDKMLNKDKDIDIFGGQVSANDFKVGDKNAQNGNEQQFAQAEFKHDNRNDTEQQELLEYSGIIYDAHISPNTENPLDEAEMEHIDENGNIVNGTDTDTNEVNTLSTISEVEGQMANDEMVAGDLDRIPQENNVIANEFENESNPMPNLDEIITESGMDEVQTTNGTLIEKDISNQQVETEPTPSLDTLSITENGDVSSISEVNGEIVNDSTIYTSQVNSGDVSSTSEVNGGTVSSSPTPSNPVKSGNISSTSEINRGTVSSSPTPSNPVKSGNISSTNELHTINKVNDRQVSSSPITSKPPITSTQKTTTNTKVNMNVSETSRTVKRQTFETDSNEIQLDTLSSLSSYYDEKDK